MSNEFEAYRDLLNEMPGAVPLRGIRMVEVLDADGESMFRFKPTASRI